MAFWKPSDESIAALNVSALMLERKAKTFAELHAWSVEQPEAFWERTVKALGIVFRKPCAKVLDVADGIPHAKWLAGAEMNIAESCFKGDRGRAAIITKRNDGQLQRITLAGLEALSNRIASGLRALGVAKGDAVAIDMAMSAEAVATYLGVVKLGAAAVSIPDSFPAEEIAKRLRIGSAKLLVTQDAIKYAGKTLPVYEKTCAADAPKTIVYPCAKLPGLKLRAGDVLWDDFLGRDEKFTPVPCSPQDVINILFSSGTTGDPKAIPWDHTTPVKAASDGFYHQDIRAGDVVCWPTSLGWMMGPWLIFATLVNGGAIALYEGAPVERGFCEFVQEAGVTMLGLVPSIAKGWRKAGCAEGLDWTKLRCFSSSGEASNAPDYQWLMQLNQKGGIKPVVEYCGGTEIGGGYLANTLLEPQEPAEFNAKALGSDFVLLNDEGKPCAVDEPGEIYIVPPAIGLSTRLLNADNDKVYYVGTPTWNGKILRRHGDRIVPLGEHRFRSDGRADNTMNLGGVKVGSAEIERVVNAVPGVVETAAIGIAPEGGGADRLIVFTVANREARADELKTHMQKAIKERLNPLFHVHEVVLIDALPRTASNKVMHRQLRDQYRKSEAA